MKMVLKFLIAAVIFGASIRSAGANEIKQEVYPVVIIGGGIGGLTSGIYLSRAGIVPLIVEGKTPSLITQSNQVENWPGEEKIPGNVLIEKIRKQALANGCVLAAKEVLEADLSKKPYELTLRDVYDSEKIERVQAHSIIIAAGTHPNRLNIPGEDKYYGKGISNCALCDGTMYKNKTVAVVGGSDAALVEAIYLSNLAKKVYIIVRKEDFRPTTDQKNKNIILNKPNVEILYSKIPVSISGDEEKVQRVNLKSAKDGNSSSIDIDGLFLAVGSIPNSSFLKGQVELDKSGYIVLKRGKRTSKEGVFAVGDIVASENKQAIIAAADGATAAIEAQKYLSKNSLGPYAPNLKPLASEGTFPSKTFKSQVLSKALSYNRAGFFGFDFPPQILASATPSVDDGKKQVAKNEALSSGEEALSGVIEISSPEEFERIVKSSNIPVLVDFYAKWCGPCKKLSPFLTDKAKKLNGVIKILKVDVDAFPSISEKYNVQSMPTMVIFDCSSNFISHKVGTDDIIKLINKIDKMKDSPKKDICDFIISQR